MALHLRALISFGVVASEGSFSRAAKTMGVTQSWVSEQVRGLEDHLGFQLFVRSNRRLELTAEGAMLYPYAEQMAQLRDETEACVRQMKMTQASRLRIGSVRSTAEIPARVELVQRFISTYERIEVEVVEDPAPVLIDRLRKRELDLLVLYDRGFLPRDQFDVLTILRLQCYILVPQEDRLAAGASFPVSELAGRSVVIAPRRQDPFLIKSVEESFAQHGINFVTAPEQNRRAVERYARTKRLSVFRWREPGQDRRMVGDMVQLPLDQGFDMELVTVRNQGVQTQNLERFWRLASNLATEVAEPRQPAAA